MRTVPQRPPQPAIAEEPSKPHQLVAGDLIEQYNYDRYLIGEDCERLLSLRGHMRAADQDRAVVLMQDAKFVTWLALQESSAILIHGNSKHVTKAATGFVCAKLFESLHVKASADDSTTIALAFFCGEHTDERTDRDAHPPGLALNLLLQLIDKMGSRWPVDSAPLQKSIRNLDFEDAGSTSALFAKLVAQLPAEVTLFVVVDGVGFYEDRSRRGEMTELVGKLLKLVGRKAGPVVKLLMATPAATIAVCGQFRSRGEQVFEMRRTYPARNGFKALGWLTAEQRIAEVGEVREQEDGSYK